MEKTKKVYRQFSLDREIAIDLDVYAARTQTSKSIIVQEVIRDFLDSNSEEDSQKKPEGNIAA